MDKEMGRRDLFRWVGRTRAVGQQFVAVIILFAVPLVILASQNVPSSVRSQEVVSRVYPKLMREVMGKGMGIGAPVFVRIFKEERELELWVKGSKGFRLFKTYPICDWGPGRLGPKTHEGDFQAPEGFYSVSAGQLNPQSIFHLSFNIGYPNEFDKMHGRTGRAIMVHGNCVSIGCYAIGDAPIEEVYTLAEAALKSGQQSFAVHIFPFRMTNANMRSHYASEWYPFWYHELKAGYDYFEKNGEPPKVSVRSGRYVFSKQQQ